MSWPEGNRDEPRDAPLPSMPTGQQPHLYLIFDDWEWGYSIRKLNLPLRSPNPNQPSFRPPLDEQQTSMRRRPEHKRLPPPWICLEAQRGLPSCFAAVGTDIVAAHPRNGFSCFSPLERFLTIVDVDDGGASPGVRFGPGLSFAANLVLIPVGDRELFALAIDCFSVLSTKPSCGPQWSWCDLPLSPVKSTDVTSFAVDSDGQTIFVSTDDCATFAFDIVNSEWRQSSDRSLPFAGPANYVPALDIFVGLSKSPTSYGHLCFCSKLSGGEEEENVRYSKENLVFKDPDASYLCAALVYLRGSESVGFCLVECLVIQEDNSVNKSALEECAQLMKCVDEAEAKLDQLEKNNVDGSSGSMRQECEELHQLITKNLDEVTKIVDECKSRSINDRYVYRLTTFSLSFDDNGDLTTGDTCVVQCYEVPKEVYETIYFQNPVAFWL